MWRWSYLLVLRRQSIQVFSTHVEVIPIVSSKQVILVSILHTCGGDPRAFAVYLYALQYSPHMWRWSQLADIKTNISNVFSTHVEVIPVRLFPGSRLWSILHTCGGDPVGDYVRKIGQGYSPHMWRWSSDGVPRGCPSSYSPHMWRLNSCSEKYVL